MPSHEITVCGGDGNVLMGTLNDVLGPVVNVLVVVVVVLVVVLGLVVDVLVVAAGTSVSSCPPHHNQT